MSTKTADPDSQVYMPSQLATLLSYRAESVRAAAKNVGRLADILGREPHAHIAFGASFTLDRIAERLVDIAENPADHALPDGGMEHAIIMTASQLFMVAAALSEPLPTDSGSEEHVVRDLAHSTWALYEQVAEDAADWKATGKSTLGGEPMGAGE